MAGALQGGRKPGILRAYFRRKSTELAYFLTSEMDFTSPTPAEDALLGLRQASALCQRGHPPASDASVLPALRQRPVQVEASKYAPAPLGAGLVEGGRQKKNQNIIHIPLFKKSANPFGLFLKNFANLHQHFSKCPAKLANFSGKVRTPQRTFSGMTPNISEFLL
jgi:hypothetical protein